MSKELIEQLAKEKAQEFKFSELGCELHSKINCGDISANAFMDIVYRTAFMEAYQAQTQGQKLIKTVYECTNCGYWYIGHTVSQCDCMPDKQEFRTMEVFTYEQTAAPIESGVKG